MHCEHPKRGIRHEKLLTKKTLKIKSKSKCGKNILEFPKKLGKKFPENREYVTNITIFFIFYFQKKIK